MSAMKALYSDIQEKIEQGKDDWQIEDEICQEYGAALTENNWLAAQIVAVRAG